MIHPAHEKHIVASHPFRTKCGKDGARCSYAEGPDQQEDTNGELGLGSPLTNSERTPKAILAQRWWLLSALGVGTVALPIRQFEPTGQNVIGLQLGYFSSYIIHPVVLVGVSLLLRGWVAPALVKWRVIGLLSCVACWLVADPLVRLPGLRRVV